MDKPKAILIDDDYRSWEHLRTSLNRELKMEVEIIPPPDLEKISDILHKDPEVILIDYELTMAAEDGTTRSYMGGSLINLLREKSDKVPLILITKGSLFRQYKDLRDQASAADLVILKSDLGDSEKGIGSRVNALVSAFQKLYDIDMEKRTWKRMMNLLAANEFEERELLMTNPPIGSDDAHRGKYASIPDYKLDAYHELANLQGWTGHDICSWLITVIFRFPGILYDSLHASASLGLDHDSFLGLNLFDESMYSGILSDFGDFWWKSRMIHQASKYLEKKGVHSRVSDGMYSYLKEEQGLDVNPSICCVSKQPFADTICYVLNEPVKKRYTLLYYPDNRPSIMEPARISFKAIAETNRVERELLLREDRRIFDKIQKGDINDWKK